MSSTLILSDLTRPWLEQWRSIASRIAENSEHVHRYLDISTRTSSSDYHGMTNSVFIPRLLQLERELRALLQAHGPLMPPLGRERLQHLLDTSFEFSARASGPPGAIALAASLSVIRSEVDPFMHDVDGPLVHVAERAFLHLQRLIVADPDCRAKWQRAFADGEVACEQLGGVHLLHHGIYAIKSNAAGERTDLVLGTAVEIAKVRRSTDGMALTEWKLIRNPAERDGAVMAAHAQARRYCAGLLAGFEIASLRFLVTVSKDHVVERADLQEGSTAYRHINIAVAPSVPSRS